MNKPRKSLNDTLATEFVYGEKEPVNSTSEPSPSKSSLMDKIQPVQAKEATKRFTVDLPESMHRKLSILSAKTGRSKADIIKTLLDDLL